MDRLRRMLPAVAAVAAVLAAGGLVFTSIQKKSLVADTGETRSEVQEALDALVGLRPQQTGDDGFRKAVLRLTERAPIAAMWLFDAEGNLVDSSRSISGGETAAGLATEQVRGAVDSLAADLLSGTQRTALFVASAIQREGAHNDVFAHMVRGVRSPDGTLVGFVGAAYDVSRAVGSPGIVWIVALLITVLSLVVYWTALPLWVFMDARTRGERAVAWAVFVLIGNFVALLGYVLSRTPREGQRS